MQIIGKARNVLIETARANKADIAWFIDNDVLIPSNAGQLVDNALELGIVSGLYFSRRSPYTPQLYQKSDIEHTPGNPLYWPLLEYQDGLMVVDAVGGGCVAIRIDVFDKLNELHNSKQTKLEATYAQLKLLEPGIYEALSTQRQHLSPWFEFLDNKGEDLYFCERAKEAGLVIWANTSIKCDHLASIPIGEMQFKYMMESGYIKKVGEV